MGQPTPTGDATNTTATGSGIPSDPSFTGLPNQHSTPEQRAGELISYLQQTQQECRADASRVEDPQASQLFTDIADMLDQPLQKLYGLQSGEQRHG